jgi:hypothetical protein
MQTVCPGDHVAMLVSALIATIHVLSLKQGHSTSLLVVHLWFYFKPNWLIGHCFQYHLETMW